MKKSDIDRSTSKQSAGPFSDHSIPKYSALHRRSFIKGAALSAVALQTGIANATGVAPAPNKRDYKRIAVEESWMPPEIFDDIRDMASAKAADEPGMAMLWGEVMRMPGTNKFREIISDISGHRLGVMDATGIDIQLLSLTAPGVQIYEKDKAVAMARLANDRLADGIKAKPDRFAGLAAVAPQDPGEAAKELERGVTKLGLKGAIINSHTKGEYLDDPKFWAIFEAAEALKAPIYLHPRTPSPDMIKPFIDYPLEGAIWGFAAEAGLHALRLILSGVFDKYPNLTIVFGHLGEGLPFWISRIDAQYNGFVLKRSKSPRARKLKRSPRDYFMDNFVITTSGMNWHDEVMFGHKVMGPDKILFAVDHPFEPAGEAVEAVDRLPLSAVDLKKLYQTNAERVFSL